MSGGEEGESAGSTSRAEWCGDSADEYLKEQVTSTWGRNYTGKSKRGQAGDSRRQERK